MTYRGLRNQGVFWLTFVLVTAGFTQMAHVSWLSSVLLGTIIAWINVFVTAVIMDRINNKNGNHTP